MHVFENLYYQYANTEIKKMSLFKANFNRKGLYWLCQIIGWGIFVLLNLLVISTYEEISSKEIIFGFFFALTGIGVTHLFKGIIKKQTWLEHPLKKIVPRIIVSSILLGIIIYGLVFTLSYILGTFKSEDFTIYASLISVINTAGVSLVWSLIYFSIHYLENYKKTEIESLIWEAAVKDYELKTLKSQLNPHFMFNSMNSIRSLIEEDPENAKIALTKLSNILRYSLRMERAESIPLGEEIKSVKDYLDLEKIRFEERLKYRLNIDTSSSHIEIPPMMIQTLVENGIKHGISKISTGGTIAIESKVHNSHLFIEIENDGFLEEDALKNSKGFGIANTKHRLNLLFGEKASFELSNNKNQKVVAKLQIPIEGVN